jgi:hypothetical protein
MVFVDLPGQELDRLRTRLAAEDIVIRGARWVVHLDVSAEDVARVGEVLQTVAPSL